MVMQLVVVARERRGGGWMGGGRRRPGAGRESAVRSTVQLAVDPAFHRAILKISLELRKPGGRSYDEVVEETARAMKLEPRSFRKYLGENGARNMSLILATARAPAR
jgi:hypothetical protein